MCSGGQNWLRAVDNSRDTHEVFRRQLRAQQGNAVEPERVGELPDERGLPDSRRTPQEYRPHDGDVQQYFG